jgi:hypothetical protein
LSKLTYGFRCPFRTVHRKALRVEQDQGGYRGRGKWEKGSGFPHYTPTTELLHLAPLVSIRGYGEETAYWVAAFHRDSPLLGRGGRRLVRGIKGESTTVLG